MSMEPNPESQQGSSIPPEFQEEIFETEKQGFPIVGIGASAGGLGAFETFFRHFPVETGIDISFVVVQHLSPDHSSILSDLIRNYTSMKVFEIEDGMPVAPNCVYVIPPNYELAISNRSLQLLPPTEPRGQRLPVDYFFTSLALDQRQLAIGLIFSGSGSDGSQGVRAIKNEGGMVMVQSPETTEFDGMPRSAIATGAADIVSDLADMPAHVIAYSNRALANFPRLPSKRTAEFEIGVQKIFVMIRARTGHDFSLYKPNTIDRRIERRMMVNQLESISEYIKTLQQNPTEIDSLFHDLLIGVTHFFRDADAFKKLAEVLLPILSEKCSQGSPLRIWIGGCSTGEEAYSIAILLNELWEHLRSESPGSQSQSFPAVQIFASDVDSRAIAFARTGLYASSIVGSMSAERLSRYFTYEPENSAYRIHKRIRELVVFSEHDINKDPPFSKLDVISCRNLMIYLGADLQRKLIPLFHFALNPEGILFLGSSEGIGSFDQLFTVLDRKAKIYRRRPDFEGMPRPRLLQHTRITANLPELAINHTVLPQAAIKTPLKELAEQAILALLAPAAAVVNEKGDVRYLLGRTGMFLEPTPGEPSVNNILKMAREGLRHHLATALHRVMTTQQILHISNVVVKTNGHFTNVSVSVCPLGEKTDGREMSVEKLYLVLMKEVTNGPSGPTILNPDTADAPSVLTCPDQQTSPDAAALIDSLIAELQAKEEFLQSAYEELESANEELKSSNEEMQSVNEELQSTNEELETSKEELQSINEELATVNSELQNKVTDLSRLNNDMNNLLSGSGIATIFVDQNLRILRFTPTMAQIINLINSDVGRPVGHIVSNLVNYDRLVTDAKAVLETLESQEQRVQTANGQWFQMRIKPYRTVENVIEGVVITFVDVTELTRTEQNLEKANQELRLSAIVRDATDAVIVHDLQGRTTAWNPSAARMYGWSEQEALQINLRERIPENLRKVELSKFTNFIQNTALDPFETERLTKDGEKVRVRVSVTSLRDESGIYAVACTERLVSE